MFVAASTLLFNRKPFNERNMFNRKISGEFANSKFENPANSLFILFYALTVEKP